MRYDGGYDEAGANYYDRRDARNRDHLVRHHQQALTRLGYQVTLAGPGDGRLPAGTDTLPPATDARLPDQHHPSPAGHRSRLRRRCRAPG